MTKLEINHKNSDISQEAHDLNHYATISNIQSWQDVLNIYQDIKQQIAPRKVFLTLDDLAQASYTSMHAIENDELYFDPEELYEGKSDDEIDAMDEQLRFYELPHFVKQLLEPKHQKKLSSFADCLTYDENDFQTLLQMNQNPLPVLDSEIVIKLVNVETEVLKFAVLPNGYFSCDLQPFENFAIIQLLAEYGFEFLGLGASLLGFVKTESFKIEKSTAFIEKLTQIYHFDLDTQNTLIQHIKSQNYLILTYTESPQDYADFYGGDEE